MGRGAGMGRRRGERGEATVPAPSGRGRAGEGGPTVPPALIAHRYRSGAIRAVPLGKGDSRESMEPRGDASAAGGPRASKISESAHRHGARARYLFPFCACPYRITLTPYDPPRPPPSLVLGCSAFSA